MAERTARRRRAGAAGADVTGAALCAGRVDLWFATDRIGIMQAIAVCSLCPEQQICLERAEDHDEQHGVWGGRLFPTGRAPQHQPAGRRPTKVRAAPTCLVGDLKAGMRIRVAEDRKSVAWTVEAVTGDDRLVRLSLRCGETTTQLVRKTQSLVDIDPTAEPMPLSTVWVDCDACSPHLEDPEPTGKYARRHRRRGSPQCEWAMACARSYRGTGEIAS